MAGYNEILTGRFNRALQKVLSMKGPASMNELSSILYPSIALFWGAESRYLEQWGLFGQAFNVPAAAGFNSTLRIRNGTPNVVCIISNLIISNPSATAGVLVNVEGPAVQGGDLAQNVTAFITRMDARGQQNTSMTATQDNTAVHANSGNTIAQLVGGPWAQMVVVNDSVAEIPLLPGDALQVRGPTVNTAIGATIFWRERVMEDSELK